MARLPFIASICPGNWCQSLMLPAVPLSQGSSNVFFQLTIYQCLWNVLRIVKLSGMLWQWPKEKEQCSEMKIFSVKKKPLNWDSYGNISSRYHRNWADVLSRIQTGYNAVKFMTLWNSSDMMILLLSAMPVMPLQIWTTNSESCGLS